jgi:hypothetical protein
MQGAFSGANTWKEGFQFAKGSPKRSLARHQKSRIVYRNDVSAVLSLPNPETLPSNQHGGSLKRSGLGKTSAAPGTSPDLSLKNIAPGSIFLELNTADNVRLALSASGELALFSVDRLVSCANLHLPISCLDITPTITERDVENGLVVRAVVRWGSAATPLAELEVTALKDSTTDSITTASTLSRGYSLDFRVPATSEDSCAEIGIHLAPSGFWFGGGHFIRQMWPLNEAALEVGPWYAFDNGPNGVNTLLGSNWMTSKGLLVSIDPDTPFLHVGMNAPMVEKAHWAQRKWGVGIQNATRELLPLTSGHGRVARAGCDGLLRFQARASYEDRSMEHPMRDWSRINKERSCGAYGTSINSQECSVDFSVDFDPQDEAAAEPAVEMLSVRVTLCATENAAAACKMALKTHTPPRQSPAAEVLRAPIWTTWARYKTKVNESKVLKYAREIADRGLPRSVMEIDDRWQTAYGELSFDEKKFPDPRAMVDELHDLGFKVTVWVHPFVEEKSTAFQEGAAKGYFVGSDAARSPTGGFMSWLRGVGAPPVIPVAPGGSAPGFFAWWNTPPVAALDVTNPEAVEWFVGRLKALQAATGIDGFKFDAGEPCFLPRNPQTHAPLTTPADYTRLYVKNVAGQFAGGVSEVRTGHLTQDVAVLCRMGDRFSTWDAGNGLRSLIPTLLTSGVLGYPFCLPDLVGGNRYFGAAPDSELLVRWTQASVLMPTLQFSIPPWDLDLDAERMVAGALDVRKKMEGLLLSLAEEAAHTLTPICRPLWMLAPHDDQTYEIHDQFALGDHVIVAPVVHKGAKRRDVYLTEGLWRDIMNPGVVVKGGQWLRGISTPLDYLPVFVKEGAPGVFF